MTSKELYMRFVKLCERWPKEETKLGRDYGEHFRDQIGKHFPQGVLSQCSDTRYVKESLDSLERLAANNYFNEKHLTSSSATGMELEQCKFSISNDGLKLLDESDENSLFKRLRNVLNVGFLGTAATEGDNANKVKLIESKSKSDDSNRPISGGN